MTPPTKLATMPIPPKLTFFLILVLIAGLGSLISACGSDSTGNEAARGTPSASDFPSAEGKTIEQLLADQTPSDLVVAPAAITFDEGKNRYPFGLFEVDHTPVEDADVALYFAKSPQSKVEGPLPAESVSLETKPAYRSQGADAPGEASSFYLVNPVNFDRSGPWLGIAIINRDGETTAARLAPSPVVGQFPKVKRVGQKAPSVSTPTASDVGGDLSKIDTRQPPSSMHDVDLKDVLGKKPVVLVFATPALCTSRVCGPVVDVAEQVKDEVGDGVAFIHNEVYVDNDMSKGERPQLTAFGLQSEPWIFLINKDGTIEKRIEGAIGVDELRSDVEQLKKSNGL